MSKKEVAPRTRFPDDRFGGMGDLDVVRRIRQVRRSLGFTQAQFAAKIGTGKVSVARYEAGRIPRADILDAIALEGSVTVDWILRGDKAAKSAERRRTSVDTHLPPLLRRLATLLEQNGVKLSNLPPGYKARYQQRADELIGRVGRELQEYVKLLNSQYRLHENR